MKQRPVCCLCLFMMIGIVLLKMWELPLMGKAPLSVLMEKMPEDHSQVQVCGTVYKRVRTDKSYSIYLEKSSLIIQSKKYPLENLRVFLKTEEKPPIGAFVSVQGEIEEIQGPRNPGEFDSKRYYECQHIRYLVKKAVLESCSEEYSHYREALESFRESMAESFRRIAGEEGELFCAMVLGEKGNLDQEVKDLYQMAGIVHIMAISGLHLSLLGMGLFHILKRTGLGNGAAGAISLAVIFQYGILTGGSVATLRAVIMLMVSIGGKVLGRTYDMLTALALGAILLLADSPANLYSSGFLLSFGAVLGMGAVLPVVQEFLPDRKWLRGLLASLCVQVTTLPVLLYFYYEISVYGLLLNLLVIPTVGAVLVSGLAGLGLGFLWLPLGRAAILPGRWLLRIYESLCRLGGSLPFCTWVGGQPALWQISVYYGILAVVLLLMKRACRKETKRERRLFQKCFPAGLAALLAGGIWILGYRGLDRFSITCLDVGQGDCLVIADGNGGHYLCDGGSSSKTSVGAYQILPYLKSQGISQVDGIFVSHTDSDHVSGIKELLQAQTEKRTSVRVKRLFLPAWKNPPEEYEKLKELAERAGVSVTCLGRGDILSGGGMEIQVLHPVKGETVREVNEDGLVFLLTKGRFRGLFTGDVGMETEKELLPYLAYCQFLKVGHHGSKNSSGGEFLEKLSPKIGVISCSAANRYGHPSPEALERLERAGTKVYITRDCGAITLYPSGDGAEIRRYVSADG